MGTLVDTLAQGNKLIEEATDQSYNYSSDMPARANYSYNNSASVDKKLPRAKK